MNEVYECDEIRQSQIKWLKMDIVTAFGIVQLIFHSVICVARVTGTGYYQSSEDTSLFRTISTPIIE